jgi:hypothetical protein
MNHVALANLLLRKARLLTALEDARGILGLEHYEELRERVRLARSHRPLDTAAWAIAEAGFRAGLAAEGRAA